MRYASCCPTPAHARTRASPMFTSDPVVPLHHYRSVDPSEAEAVAQCVLDVGGATDLRDVVQIAAGIGRVEVQRRWQPLLLESERGDRQLDRTRGAERMPVVRLRAAHLQPRRMIPEDGLHGE